MDQQSVRPHEVSASGFCSARTIFFYEIVKNYEQGNKALIN